METTDCCTPIASQVGWLWFTPKCSELRVGGMLSLSSFRYSPARQYKMTGENAPAPLSSQTEESGTFRLGDYDGA